MPGWRGLLQASQKQSRHKGAPDRQGAEYGGGCGAQVGEALPTAT